MRALAQQINFLETSVAPEEKKKDTHMFRSNVNLKGRQVWFI